MSIDTGWDTHGILLKDENKGIYNTLRYSNNIVLHGESRFYPGRPHPYTVTGFLTNGFCDPDRLVKAIELCKSY